MAVLISTLLKHPSPCFMQGMVLPGAMLAMLALPLPGEQGPVAEPGSVGRRLVPVPLGRVTGRGQPGRGTGLAAARRCRVLVAAPCVQLPRWEASREGQHVIKMC